MLQSNNRVTEITKICTQCKIALPYSSFCKDPNQRNNLAPNCRKCKAARATAWRKKHPARAKKTSRDYHLNKKYKLSQAAFEALLLGQSGKCAICKCTLSVGSIHTCVDHDHMTGKVRGILCRKCNSGIGQFGDNASMLELAAIYLRDRNGGA